MNPGGWSNATTFLFIHKWVSTLDPIILWEKFRGLCQLSVFGLRRTNEELNEGVKDLIKYLLNNPVRNNTRWPDYNKKVKQETNQESDNRSNGLKWHLSHYWHLTFDQTMALPIIALPTMALYTIVGPNVQFLEPIRPTKAIKQMRDQLI